MIIRNIFRKLYIHPLFYFFTVLFLITGHIYNYLLFTLIIFIHELGHTLVACIFKWKIDKICIYPYGGISKFSTLVNVLNYQEFFVLISGPILQVIFMFLFINFLSVKYHSIFIFYNMFILIFNLLPIYPLDGGKLMKIAFSEIFNFKFSLFLSFLISCILIGILLALSIIIKNYIFFIIILFLYFKLLGSNINEIYNKFLLERYLYNFKFKRCINVKSINKLKKDREHVVNGIMESECLKKYFISY